MCVTFVTLYEKRVKQSVTGPEWHRVFQEVKVPDFITTAQDGGKLSDLRSGLLNPQEILLVLIYVRG